MAYQRSLDTLKLGDEVHDMHYLFDPSIAFGEKARSIRVCMDCPGGDQVIVDLLRRQGVKHSYVNKMLVLVGTQHDYTRGMTYTFAYSYDGCRLGFITIYNSREK